MAVSAAAAVAAALSAVAGRTAPGEFDGYSRAPVSQVRALDAFADPEFEGRDASCFKATESVRLVPGCGFNGSGGLRVKPPLGGKVRVDFSCKVVPQPGKKYVFSILRRRNENGFAHVVWSCHDKAGRDVKANWNMKKKELPAGWEEIEVEVAPPAGKEIARHSFFTIVQATGSTAEKKNNPNAYVDFDLIGLREDVPEWMLCNTWPIRNRVYREEGRVRFHSSFVGDVVPPGSRVRYRVELIAADGNRLGDQALKADANGVFTADFGRLAHSGPATLRVSLADDTHRTIAGVKEIPVAVEGRPAEKPDTIYVPENGVCVMNGRPFMPVGFFTCFGKGNLYTRETTETRLREMRENGFNCITEYWPAKWDKPGSGYYELCASNGISVLYNLNQIYHNATDEGVARFCAKAKGLASEHRAIVGWYAFDEVTKDWAPFLEKFRRALGEATPDKVSWYVNIHEPEPMLPCGDIQGGDIYPIDVGGRDLEPMDRYVAKCMACRPAAAWHCPQSMNWGNYRPGLKDNRERYLKEAREPTENEYLSVALLYASHGVKGFIFYHFQDIFTGPVPELYDKRWEAMKSVGRTLRSLEPFIMSGRPIVEVPHKDVKGRTRLVLLTDADGRKVVIAIGLKRDNECTFTLPDGRERTFRGKDFSCEIFRCSDIVERRAPIQPMVCPAPKSMELDAGRWVALDGSVPVRVATAAQGAPQWVAAHWEKWFGARIKAESVDAASAPQGEGAYGLEVSEDGIAISAATLSGVRHAMYSLRQLSMAGRGTLKVARYIAPAVKIADAPALKWRGMHLCWFPETSVSFVERFIRICAYLKFNYLVLEPWGVFRSEKFPWLGWSDGKLTKAEAARLCAIANDLGVTLVPQVNVFGHAANARGCAGKHATLDLSPEYQPLFEPLMGWNWCLSNPEAKRVLREYVAEVHEAFGNPPYFHLGCDEATPPSCPECSKGCYADLVADHIRDMAEAVRERGARPIVWHDMYLATGDRRFPLDYCFGTGETAARIDRLPKYVVIAEWNYLKPYDDGDFPALRYFRELGFDVLTCPWDKPDGIDAQGRFAQANPWCGYLGTTWHHASGNPLRNMLVHGAHAAWGGDPAPFCQPWHARIMTLLRQVQWDMPVTDRSQTGVFEADMQPVTHPNNYPGE